LTAPEAWPSSEGGIALGDGRMAHTEFHPADVPALCETIREQVALRRAIYPQGGKTSLDYGGTPARPGVAISTCLISRLIDYPHADMTITVEAGMTLARLSAILAGQGQRLLVEAPFPDRATLGGIYTTNTGGPRRFGAGRPRDQIIGVSFVTSEGVVVKGGGRVVKNVAGYDLPKLLTGSMGTLGIITQLTLKVRPIPEKSAIAWVRFRTLHAAEEALEMLNVSGTRPIAVELLNLPAARSIGKEPGLPEGEIILVIGYEENAPTVTWQLDRLHSELKDADLTIVGEGETATLWTSLIEFQAAAMGVISFVANVRPSSLAPFLAKTDPALWSVQAHAGNGIVRGHALGEESFKAAAAQIEVLRRIAVADGGNLILSRCPADLKETLHVWGEPRADWVIGERVKAALDPHHSMNPGRFVGRI
jgi:glycolate dehydrogenase FAD-binding subunit